MSTRPTVDFCGLNPPRLIIGANPFGGFSHQNKERDEEMVAYSTPERIRETWARAEAAGINTMITNNETPHVLEAVSAYLSEGGKLQWIAQVSGSRSASMAEAIDQAVDIGCKAMYFHGGVVDKLYSEGDAATLESWVAHAHSRGVPVGVAGHAPETHFWVDDLGLVDFHAVCFFNCGSLHAGKGHKFRLADLAPAAECVRRLAKPCIAYKVMAAGRIDATIAFEYAFENIKPTDVVNIGVHRGDRDDMVEADVTIVRALLEP